MNKAYSRINNGKGWENFPSDKTAVDENNLNHMEIGIDEIDNRVVVLDETKATKLEVSELFEDASLDLQSGIITFTRKNGATVTIDTPMEKIQTGIYYNPNTEMLVLPLIDGTSMEVDLSRLMKFDEFIDSDTIAFSVKPNGIVTAIVKEGSIQEKHLRPDYLADIRVETSKAAASASAAEESRDAADSYAKKSQSYAVGTGNARPNEATDNAKYYYEQSKDIYDNFSNAGNVTGVKGNAESSYRTGNVNLTPADIGAPSMEYMKDHFVADYVSSAKVEISSKGWYRVAKSVEGMYGNSCAISVKRGYSSPSPEYQKVQLVDSFKSNEFIPIVSFTGSDGNHLFTKIRKTYDTVERIAYIEVYQNRDTYKNGWTITIEDALSAYGNPWKNIELTATQEEVSGVTVMASLDLPANFDSAHNIMDADNNSNISFSYHKPGLTSADWLAAWNGYELRAMAPSKVTGVGSAVKATQDGNGNIIADTYWNKSKSLILAEEVESSKLTVFENAVAEEVIQLNLKPGYTAIAAIPGKITSEKICWGSCELSKSGGYTTISIKLRNVTGSTLMFYAYVIVLYLRTS